VVYRSEGDPPLRKRGADAHAYEDGKRQLPARRGRNPGGSTTAFRDVVRRRPPRPPSCQSRTAARRSNGDIQTAERSNLGTERVPSRAGRVAVELVPRKESRGPLPWATRRHAQMHVPVGATGWRGTLLVVRVKSN
jgi:hypothetical protein